MKQEIKDRLTDFLNSKYSTYLVWFFDAMILTGGGFWVGYVSALVYAGGEFFIPWSSVAWVLLALVLSVVMGWLWLVAPTEDEDMNNFAAAKKSQDKKTWVA